MMQRPLSLALRMYLIEMQHWFPAESRQLASSRVMCTAQERTCIASSSRWKCLHHPSELCVASDARLKDFTARPVMHISGPDIRRITMALVACMAAISRSCRSSVMMQL